MTMPRGFFGTRADLFMDVGILLLTLLPALMLWAFRLARNRRLSAHRNVQTATLAVVLIVLVLFEIDIRLRGGSAAFLAQYPERAAIVRGILRAHLVTAAATFLAWLELGVVSWIRFRRVLPGAFSLAHKRVGRFTFVGACLLSASGALMYALLYVV
jgi:putative membrane protein